MVVMRKSGPKAKPLIRVKAERNSTGHNSRLFLRWRETWDVVAGRVSFGFNANQGFAFGPRLAHNYHGAKGFRVQAGHQNKCRGCRLSSKAGQSESSRRPYSGFDCSGEGAAVSNLPGPFVAQGPQPTGERRNAGIFAGDSSLVRRPPFRGMTHLRGETLLNGITSYRWGRNRLIPRLAGVYSKQAAEGGTR